MFATRKVTAKNRRNSQEFICLKFVLFRAKFFFREDRLDFGIFVLRSNKTVTSPLPSNDNFANRTLSFLTNSAIADGYSIRYVRVIVLRLM